MENKPSPKKSETTAKVLDIRDLDVNGSTLESRISAMSDISRISDLSRTFRCEQQNLVYFLLIGDYRLFKICTNKSEPDSPLNEAPGVPLLPMAPLGIFVCYFHS